MKALSPRIRQPRWQRKRQILKILHAYPGKALTMRQIAFWLTGIAPSNHLMQILHEMEAEQMIYSETTVYRANSTKLEWSISVVGKTVIRTISELEGG